MPLVRSDSGIWSFPVSAEDGPVTTESPQEFFDGTLFFLNAFDMLFERARARTELEFLFCLFRLRGGHRPPGWDPFETTMEAIPAIGRIHRESKVTVYRVFL